MRRITIYTTAFNLSLAVPAVVVDEITKNLAEGETIVLTDGVGVEAVTYWINPANVCAILNTYETES